MEDLENVTVTDVVTADEFTPVVSKKSDVAVQQTSVLNVPVVDVMTMTEMPDLENAQVLPLDLSSEYWTPVNAGESKRLIFIKIENTQVQDITDPSVILDLPCVYFLEKTDEGVKQIRNGSKRLVAAVENVRQGTPLLLQYRGKVRNKNNSFMSDNWSVKPLILNV
jgi:hypothetical protein